MSTIGNTVVTFIAALCLVSIANLAAAQTIRYVSDDFQVPVRDAPKQDSRVVTLISSGTKVEVLDEGFKGFSLIRAQGVEGWVRTQDLMAIPSGRARLAEAEKRFEERRIALEQRNQEVKDLNARVEDLEQQDRILENHNRELKSDLEALRKRTAKPLATEEENRRLEQAVQQERETVRRLLDENDALKVQAIRDWFLVGAAVSLGCLLLGVIIAGIPWRKQRSW